ncbi:MAG: hypothetical protein PHT69_12780 [Bacteroidales bacterium]|nr:hypothetical protein [Bacteroidales bacterium]
MKKDQLPESFKKSLENGRNAFDAILKDKVEVEYYFIPDIKIAEFPDPEFDKNNTENQVKYKEKIYSVLKDIKGPCIYYFEIPLENKRIFDAYKKFQESQKNVEDKRSTPALKGNPPINKTYVLYVGSFEKQIDGRIVVHFGYYSKGSYGGLNLVQWGKEKDLNLVVTLHIYAFPDFMKSFIKPLEKALAHELNPLVGYRR